MLVLVVGALHFCSKGLKFDPKACIFFAIYITVYRWGKSIFEVTKRDTAI